MGEHNVRKRGKMAKCIVCEEEFPEQLVENGTCEECFWDKVEDEFWGRFTGDG